MEILAQRQQRPKARENSPQGLCKPIERLEALLIWRLFEEISAVTGMFGGGRSGYRVSAPQFPDNREKNREFCNFGGDFASCGLQAQ
jgi:hypothetical protein